MAETGRPRKCHPKVESLFIDIEKGRNDFVKNILNDINIDEPDGEGRTALINAAACNNIDLIKWLLEKGANINYQDRTGYSALHFAGQNKVVELAKFLLLNGADPNLKDKFGNTPLRTAVHGSALDSSVAKLMLQYKGDPDIKNNYGNSPRSLYQLMFNADISQLT